MENDFLKSLHFDGKKKQLADNEMKRIIEEQLNEIIQFLQNRPNINPKIIDVVYKEKENILNLFNEKYLLENTLVCNKSNNIQQDITSKIKQIIRRKIDKEIEMFIVVEEDEQIVSYMIEKKLIIDALLSNTAKFLQSNNMMEKTKSQNVK